MKGTNMTQIQRFLQKFEAGGAVRQPNIPTITIIGL